jgi:ectoine hydroxylase-related dioxygenase (phytanoyl-CoA dioxygenase family)
VLATQAYALEYRRHGYAVVPGVIGLDRVSALRHECERFIELIHQEMDELGTDVLDISHRGKRYFVELRHQESSVVTAFVHSEEVARLGQALLGSDDIYLFFEQFVVKSPGIGMPFSWHQDSGYLADAGGPEHRPYLTLWCPLVDVGPHNGSISVLPYERVGGATLRQHWRDAQTRDRIGYDGDEPGVEITAAAGDVVAFSSLTLHSSGANRSAEIRPVYLVQLSSEPILDSTTGDPWAFATPLLRGGDLVPPSAQPDDGALARFRQSRPATNANPSTAPG